MIYIVKQRLITAAIGLSLMVVILFFYQTVVLNIVVSLIGFAIVYELLLATKYSGNAVLSAAALIFSALIPFYREPYFNEKGKVVIMLFVFALFVIMLIYRKTLRIEQVGLVFFISTVIPIAVSSIVYIRDEYAEHGLFLILLTLGLAWLADAGGFLFGILFGKHKLAPEISPKKTIEGLVGSFIANILFVLIMGIIYSNLSEGKYAVSLLPLIIISVICTVLSVLGDLSASIIKRQCQIKDFGSIMPGHGGVLDRFDSVLFVAPFIYYVLYFIDVVKPV